MYVELASAGLDQKMQDTWGRPTPMDQQFEEWFGYYHVEDDTRYWSYTPQNQIWRVRNGTTKPNLIGTNFSKADRDQIIEDMEILAWFPPADPEDPTARTETPPFLHNGWLYVWYYFPELKRWQIAPLGRR